MARDCKGVVTKSARIHSVSPAGSGAGAVHSGHRKGGATGTPFMRSYRLPPGIRRKEDPAPGTRRGSSLKLLHLLFKLAPGIEHITAGSKSASTAPSRPVCTAWLAAEE